MGTSTKAMFEGVIDKVTLAAMAEQGLGATAEAEHGDDPGYVVLRGGELRRTRHLFVCHNDLDNVDAMPGMRTIVSTGTGPEGEAILRALLAFRGGVLNRNDAEDEWEHVPVTRTFERTPDQEMYAALHALAEPNDVMALVRTCSDPERRAALEAALAARREAEPEASPRP